ncbi:hypothetical protein [Nocardioides cynanchi]|uniref:hypothetical protein n=1 Tax=Nocardioides cynanchi TaxID=2558918 RepID=UPI00124949C3|nr:hypothetical protein [Nocardioides cynanchi]
MATEELQRFRPTNGRAMGVLGIVLCVAIAAVFVTSASAATAVPATLACAAAGVLIWAAMLRPSVSATSDELRMRTMFETVEIPLASIDTVLVRRYLLIRSGGRKYICPAISRSLRKTVRSEMKWNGGGGGNLLMPGVAADGGSRSSVAQDAGAQQDMAYPDFVEQQIQHLARTDRARLGIEERSEEEYELGSRAVRRPAWIEIIALAALVVAFVVSLVL